MPVAGHRIAIRIELWLDIGQTFDGLAFRRFDFEFKQRRWPVQIQNMWLSHVPKSEARCSDDNDRETHSDQPDQKPKPSYSSPVKREKNRAWRNDHGNDQRNGNGKITCLAFKWRDMKRGREGRAESKAEKQSGPDADNSSKNSEENC